MRALGAEIEYRNGYYFARSPGRLRGGPRSSSRSCRSWAPRTRCSPRSWPTAGRRSARPPQEPEVDDLIAFLQRWAPRSSGPRRTRSRSIGRKRLRGGDHRVVPDRIEAGTFVVAAADHRWQGDPPRRALRPPRRLPRDARTGRGQRVLRRRHDRGVGRRSRPVSSGRHRDRAVSRPGHRPPAPDLRPADPGRRREPRPRDDLRGPARVPRRAPPDGRPDPTSPARTTPRSPGRPAPRRRDRDRRPARRGVDDPGRPGGRRRLDHPRCAPRSPGV